MNGDGDRICLFCDKGCDENLEHLMWCCPAWNTERAVMQGKIEQCDIDIGQWNYLLAETRARIMLGSTVSRSDVDNYFLTKHYESFDEISMTFLEDMQKSRKFILETRNLQYKSKHNVQVDSDEVFELF